MREIKVKNIEIGVGIPKICVSVTASSINGVITEIDGFLTSEKPFDIIEWRADYYDPANLTAELLRCLKAIDERIKNKALIFTFRTKNEGGMRELSAADYETLISKAIESGCADIVDIQMDMDTDTVKRLIHKANEHDVTALISNHDFNKTPCKEAIIKKLCLMHEIGGDIAKIAVMPNTLSDVCAILGASAEMVECYADKPFVLISMSGMGFISRICGEAFGSAITYGSINKKSAPGQAEADELGILLKLIHKYM